MALGEPLSISLISMVELEGGIVIRPELAASRRRLLDALARQLTIVDVDQSVLAGYRRIVEQVGFSRRKIIDRLIAATAIVHDLTLVTINGKDFRDIPGLRIEVWPAPAQ